MPIVVQCPSAGCGQRVRVPDSVAGRAFKCPRCKEAVIEAPTALAAPQPVAAKVPAAKQAAPKPPAPEPKLAPPKPPAAPATEEFVEVMDNDAELVEVIEESPELVEVIEEKAEFVEVIDDNADLVVVEEPVEELVEIMPDDGGQIAAAPAQYQQPAAPPPPAGAQLQAGELVPSTPGWHQAAMLRPKHLSVRIRKGFTGPDFKIMDRDSDSKEPIGGAWKKGKRQKRDKFFELLYKGITSTGEVDLFIREEKDSPVIFSVRMIGKAAESGRMATCERVEIYDENENPVASVRFDVFVLFEELKSLMVFDLNNQCIAKTKKRTVKAQKTKQKVPYIALMDGNDEEVGKITTEQREIVQEEERQGWLLGTFDAHGVTALVRKRYDTPSTRVILLSIVLTLKLTNAWEGGLKMEGR